MDLLAKPRLIAVFPVHHSVRQSTTSALCFVHRMLDLISVIQPSDDMMHDLIGGTKHFPKMLSAQTKWKLVRTLECINGIKIQTQMISS